MTPTVQRQLHAEYIVALIERLRAKSSLTDASALCDRIERNLDVFEAIRALDEDDARPLPPDVAAKVALAEELDAAFPEARLLPSTAVDLTPTNDAVPAALTGPRGDASGAPIVALDGGSEKPAEALSLTPRQSAVMDAIRAANGVQSAAAKALEVSSGSLVGMVSALRKAGTLPAEVEALIEPHRLKMGARDPAARIERELAGIPPASKRDLRDRSDRNKGRAAATIAVAQDDEAAAIHEVAERIKAREATPAQNEKSGETFEERRLRFARERVAAGRSSY
jgi:hypothetical protein